MTQPKHKHHPLKTKATVLSYFPRYWFYLCNLQWQIALILGIDHQRPETLQSQLRFFESCWLYSRRTKDNLAASGSHPSLGMTLAWYAGAYPRGVLGCLWTFPMNAGMQPFIRNIPLEARQILHASNASVFRFITGKCSVWCRRRRLGVHQKQGWATNHCKSVGNQGIVTGENLVL